MPQIHTHLSGLHSTSLLQSVSVRDDRLHNACESILKSQRRSTHMKRPHESHRTNMWVHFCPVAESEVSVQLFGQLLKFFLKKIFQCGGQ